MEILVCHCQFIHLFITILVYWVINVECSVTVTFSALMNISTDLNLHTVAVSCFITTCFPCFLHCILLIFKSQLILLFWNNPYMLAEVLAQKYKVKHSYVLSFESIALGKLDLKLENELSIYKIWYLSQNIIKLSMSRTLIWNPFDRQNLRLTLESQYCSLLQTKWPILLCDTLRHLMQ